MQIHEQTETKVVRVGTRYDFGWHELLGNMVDLVETITGEPQDWQKSSLIIGDQTYDFYGQIPSLIKPALSVVIRE